MASRKRIYMERLNDELHILQEAHASGRLLSRAIGSWNKYFQYDDLVHFLFPRMRLHVLYPLCRLPFTYGQSVTPLGMQD